MTEITKLPITPEDEAQSPVNVNYGYDSPWFELNNPNAVRPCVVKALGKQMLMDTDGLYLENKPGNLWFRNRHMAEPNKSYSDVVAVIPKSTVFSLYTMLQRMLKGMGLLNDKNELAEEEGGKESGYTTEWEKKGLRG